MLGAADDWQPICAVVIAAALLGQGALQAFWGTLGGATVRVEPVHNQPDPDCSQAWETIAEIRFEARWWKWAAQVLLGVWLATLLTATLALGVWCFCSGLCGCCAGRASVREAPRRPVPARSVKVLAIHDGEF